MEHHPQRGLRLIAIFRLIKVVLLIATGIGLIRLLDVEVQDSLEDWLESLPFLTQSAHMQEAISRATHPSTQTVTVAVAAAAAYAVLYFTEGMGLWLGYVWAEYLTIAATASFIPIEIFEIYRHVSALRIMFLIANIAIVAYLVHHRLRARAAKNKVDNKSLRQVTS